MERLILRQPYAESDILEDLNLQLESRRIALWERVASANNCTILCLSADMNSSLSNGLMTLRAYAIYKVLVEAVVNSSSVTS